MNDNVEILRRYNRWRRGQALWSATADLPDPRVVGEAIDAACDEIERLRAELAAYREALLEVMDWIAAWEPDFVATDGWVETKIKVRNVARKGEGEK